MSIKGDLKAVLIVVAGVMAAGYLFYKFKDVKVVSDASRAYGSGV